MSVLGSRLLLTVLGSRIFEGNGVGVDCIGGSRVPVESEIVNVGDIVYGGFQGLGIVENSGNVVYDGVEFGSPLVDGTIARLACDKRYILAFHDGNYQNIVYSEEDAKSVCYEVKSGEKKGPLYGWILKGNA